MCLNIISTKKTHEIVGLCGNIKVTPDNMLLNVSILPDGDPVF